MYTKIVNKDNEWGRCLPVRPASRDQNRAAFSAMCGALRHLAEPSRVELAGKFVVYLLIHQIQKSHSGCLLSN